MKKKIIYLVTIFLLTMLSITLISCEALNYKVFPDWAFEKLRQEDANMASDADVRIMSANVLVRMKSWGGSPVKPRAQMFAETINHFKPDVIGLQEMCEDWHKYLPSQVSENYTVIDTKNTNYTPMMYNHNRLKLIENGYYIYSKNTNKKCRAVTWGVFEFLATGKRFVVTTTHWDFGMEKKKVDCRNVQIDELASTIKDLSSKYNCPVFATGDYNVLEKDKESGAESYDRFLDVSQLVDAKFSNNIEKRHGEAVSYEEETWDHIFINEKVKPLMFNILANDFYIDLSDHYLIYLDAKLL